MSSELRRRVAPLVLATMTSQALLVVLAPTISATGAEIGATVAAVGQARTVSATVAIIASLLITVRIAQIGVRRLLLAGSVLTLLSCAAVAAAPNLLTFLVAHVLVGAAFACQLTAGFAGLSGFSGDRRPWAIGYVTGANALAWVVVNPLAGAVTQWWSWRAAYAIPVLIALGGVLTAGGAAPAGTARSGGLPVRTVIRDRSARSWVLSELLAYLSWTSLITFLGAFFIERFGLGEAAVGWLLAAAAAAYIVASTRSARLVARLPRRMLAAVAALVMAVLLVVLLDVGGLGVAGAATVFCLIGLTAGVRTPVSSGLGLDQLPSQQEAMMAVRTATTQLGYLLGALLGGAVIATVGYPALGGVLAVGMTASALLLLRVKDPTR